MNVQQILAELIRIDSVSARSNREIISYIAAHTEASGMRARFFPYMDEHGVEKVNLLAIAPSSTRDEEEIELALVGHTDTVPYDPTWIEATTLTERDGQLYGRGACDTKGFIAAALTALHEIETTRLRRPVALVFTADEEVGCLGAKQLADACAFRARFSIVGEPTSLQPIRAGKGYCLAEVIVGGREGHSAYPALGASAIFRAARLITCIEAVAEQLKADQHLSFDPPYTTLNIGIINGGTAKNIIAGECRFTLEWRPVPGQTAERVIDGIKGEVESLRAADEEFACQINIIRLDQGMETPADSPLVRTLEEVTGRSAGAVAFGTEAPQMAELGAQAVIFGPGNIRVAHRTGEFVPVAELNSCVDVLARVIKRFCL